MGENVSAIEAIEAIEKARLVIRVAGPLTAYAYTEAGDDGDYMTVEDAKSIVAALAATRSGSATTSKGSMGVSSQELAIIEPMHPDFPGALRSSASLKDAWLPIEFADKTISQVQDFSEVGITLRNSDRYWVRDDDGRVYEASWTEGERSYWWDWEGESPVDPVEFMPHPLDPRWLDADRCRTCDGTGMEARHQLCRDCDEAPANVSSGTSPIRQRGDGDG